MIREWEYDIVSSAALGTALGSALSLGIQPRYVIIFSLAFFITLENGRLRDNIKVKYND